MKVYVVARINDGGSIRGVYITQRSAMNNLGMCPRDSGWDVYEKELSVDRLLNKHKELILTILATSEDQDSEGETTGEKDV